MRRRRRDIGLSLTPFRPEMVAARLPPNVKADAYKRPRPRRGLRLAYVRRDGRPRVTAISRLSMALKLSLDPVVRPVAAAKRRAQVLL